MIDFVDFLLEKVYNSIKIPEFIIKEAYAHTVLDVQYHFAQLTEKEIEGRIITNSNELTIFLFRLGRALHVHELEKMKPQIHWLLKELCASEIYFNNEIDKGFYVLHCGVVIGSRNIIGKGFKVHQGCTIGHKVNGKGKGNVIGDNVVMYCNASIIGALLIGDNVVIGAHALVNKNVENNKTVISSIKMKTV